MATRALITIDGMDKIGIYKHWDGYPEATLPWLEKFHKDYLDNRGWDPEYELAQLLRSSIADAEEFELDKSKYIGWGIVDLSTGDEYGAEYEYILVKDGIKIYYFDYETRAFVLKQVISFDE